MKQTIAMALAGLALPLCLVLLAGAASAESKTYAWCLFYDSSTYNCGFSTYQQCLETSRGSGGLCRPNPFEAPRPRQPRRPKQN